jgi:hypothetical protein
MGEEVRRLLCLCGGGNEVEFWSVKVVVVRLSLGW